VLQRAEDLQRKIVPSDIEIIVTRNYGQTADEKVNGLIEGIVVAILIVVALLTIGLGWRQALIVAVAVPVVFGLTLAVNLMLGYTINRVTLFALILSLGLLLDDPIVDVENITRHFALRKKATRRIVFEAMAEIRPPLITATLAIIVSFLPLFFITGMIGPYMRPMALNVPVAAMIEERDLISHFGRQYQDYRRRVPMFVPRLNPLSVGMSETPPQDDSVSQQPNR
jgi:multidrug efflux pump subunit AcrB